MMSSTQPPAYVHPRIRANYVHRRDLSPRVTPAHSSRSNSSSGSVHTTRRNSITRAAEEFDSPRRRSLSPEYPPSGKISGGLKAEGESIRDQVDRASRHQNRAITRRNSMATLSGNPNSGSPLTSPTYVYYAPNQSYGYPDPITSYNAYPPQFVSDSKLLQKGQYIASDEIPAVIRHSPQSAERRLASLPRLNPFIKTRYDSLSSVDSCRTTSNSHHASQPPRGRRYSTLSKVSSKKNRDEDEMWLRP